MSRKKLFLFGFVLVSIGELVSSAIHDSSHYFFKPLILLTLMGYYLTSTKERNTTLLYALFFCWVGDILLMFGNIELYFMLGLLSFLIGHVFYIFTFRQIVNDSNTKLLPTQKARYSFPIFLAGTGLIVVVYPGLGPLKLPVIAYGIILMVMVASALFRVNRTNTTSFILAFIGAILFMISDSILAINKFHSSIPESAFFIMTTYIAAQFLIVKGTLNH